MEENIKNLIKLEFNKEEMSIEENSCDIKN